MTAASESLTVLGLGAGGHGAVVLEILRACSSLEVVGFLDPRRELWGTQVLGVAVLGDDDLLSAQYYAGVHHAFIGLGSTADTRPRRRLYEKARALGFDFPQAIHPRAIVSDSVECARAVVVAAGAVVGTRARIGENTIVNSGAVVEHDCVIAGHVHVATGARLAGEVTIGEGAHIGLGALVLQGVTIGEGAIVGAGSVVLHDVAPRTVVVGAPARHLRNVA